MGYPSISQWIDTVANPHGRFRTLGEFEAERDAYGNIRFTAGNSAAVFPVVSKANGRRMLLKCFIKDARNRKPVYDMVSGSCDPLLSPTGLRQDEAYVYDELGNGGFYDTAVGEWVEGNTLETEIRRAAREYGAPRFAELAAIFDELAAELLSRDWAHGDLKPDNIIITSEDSAVLIDYDAMYVPDGEPTGEIGTPGYQHPARTAEHYGPFLDDYPAALISASLHALALNPELYAKFHKGDGLIFNPEEVCAGRSEAYDEVLELFADHGEYALYGLALTLKSPTPEILDLRGKLNINTAPHTVVTNDKPKLYESSGLWGYSTGSENITLPIFGEAFEFSENLGVAKLRGSWHVIDTSGRKVFGTDADILKPFGCGLAAFRRDGKWGYLDDTGTVAVEPRFDRAGTMHEGMAAVCADGKYGFINRSGDMVIDAAYDRARGFRNGQAEVQLDGETFCINLSGERI